jgi:hypothetical protein
MDVSDDDDVGAAGGVASDSDFAGGSRAPPPPASASALFGSSAAAAAASRGGAPARGPLPWVEKWRPKGMGDIASQEDAVRTLRAAVASGALPHLLFYGPPGTGKTSTILALARELYGCGAARAIVARRLACARARATSPPPHPSRARRPELMKVRVMELNASDERGIAVVREKIKSFAASSVGSAVGCVPPRRAAPRARARAARARHPRLFARCPCQLGAVQAHYPGRGRLADGRRAGGAAAHD